MISFRSSSRFPLSSGRRRKSRDIPARVRETGDEPGANRIGILRHDNGNRGSCFLGETRCGGTFCDDKIYVQTHQLRRERGEAIDLSSAY